MVARWHARRVLVRPRQRARQRLQHLDPGHAEQRSPPDHQESRGRLHAVVVAGRQGDRVYIDARRRSVDLGGERRRWQRAQSHNCGRPCRCAVVGRRRARLPRHHWRRPRRHGRRARVVALRDGGQDGDRQRERLRVPRLVGVAERFLLRLGRQDPEAQRRWRQPADDRVQRDAAGHPRHRQLHAPQARLHVGDAAAGARRRASGDFDRRQADRVRRNRTSTSCPSAASR